MQRAHGSFGDHAAVPPQDVGSRSAFSYPPTSQDWSRIQDQIYEYYVKNNQPLHIVRKLLQNEHGFRATERMIKARLAKWEYVKNAKREDWGYLAVLHEIRKKENKPTAFDIRGHRKTVKDLQRFVRNQNISPEKFLAESFDSFRGKGKQVPDYIRAFTPDPDDSLYSPSAETSLSEHRSPSPSPTTATEEFLLYRDPAKSQRDNFEHDCPYDSYAHEPVTPRPGMSSTQPRPFYTCEKTRRELEACSNQLLKPVPLRSRIGHNDMRCWSIISNRAATPSHGHDVMDVDLTEHDICTRCEQPNTVHFPSLDLFEPTQGGQRNILNDATGPNLQLPTSMREEGSWVWVSLCFLACMSLRRGDEDVAQRVLDQAATKFEKLLRAQDPLLLTAAGLMITMLHMHDQQRIAVRILECAKAMVDRVLADSESDPVRITISYLALSADASGELLRNANFGSARLKPVYHKLRETHSSRHPYVIAAHYNYAWMLKYEGKSKEAEKHAREVYRESIGYFGHMHMQTVTSLSVIAGCLALQPDKDRECIEAYRTMIKNATQILGIIHPYTLEAQRRLADKLEQMPGQMIIALRIHRTILFGRATMLGRNHEFTIGQKMDYERMLRKLNRWTDRQGVPSKDRREVEDLFTKDPEEAWELVSRIDDDVRVTNVPGGDMPSASTQEDEWCRLAIVESLSRSQSPPSGNEYEAY